MDNLITFLDIETPNRKNDRICSIGLVRTDMSGRLVDERYSLIDPEAPFDEVNMKVHGICGSDVSGARTFADEWGDGLSELLVGAPVVAHNAKFDLCVLSKAHFSYFGTSPEFTYACTMDLASRYLPGIGSRKLPDVCAALGVPMSGHHNALEDARACASAFWAMSRACKEFKPDFSVYRREIEYEYAWTRMPDGSVALRRVEFSPGRAHSRCSDKNQAKRQLLALLRDVVSDGDVSIEEAVALIRFINENEEMFSDSSVIGSLSDMLQEVIMDGVMDDFESETISEMIERIVDPSSQETGPVDIDGKLFVVTGTFRHGTRDTVHRYIESKGGSIAKSVTKKCDYVVIGDYGSEAYSLVDYGTKVQKALALQEKGVPIKIIKEADLFGES